MKKILMLLLALIFVAFCFFGCTSSGKNNTPEESENPYAIWGVAQSYYASLEELLAHTEDEAVVSGLKDFPVDKFSKLTYFTTYYEYDTNHNFPVSAIAFSHQGVEYFYAGAAKDDVFFRASIESIYYGYKGEASEIYAQIPLLEEVSTCCMVRLPEVDAMFTLATERAHPPSFFLDMLSQITNDTYHLASDGITSVEDSIVSVYYISAQLVEGNYTLSSDGILQITHESFAPVGGEIQIFTEEEEEAGADYVKTPAILSLDFVVVGEGTVTLSILDGEENVLYAIDIIVQAEDIIYLSQNAPKTIF
ncbi:MAG: hypothetical protein ACOX3W_04740 [Christensenellaceae bacterium]